MTDFNAMFKAARAIRERAYAPYSLFKVGACLEGSGGALFTGCNVENATYPQGQCAEASAIAAMIAAGERKIRAIVVVGGGDELCTPCGGCRQKLSEFAKPSTPVHICGPEGVRHRTTLGELLPRAFGPQNLNNDEARDEDEDRG